ncbi:MAG TPA: alanine dehydrogenase [Bacteroidota bacterium]|nr:alanine dehydrogenase [Bacteroidota bacterium]
MIIGIPKEIKTNEDRVSLVPVGAETLTRLGHSVLVETKAGLGSGFDDESYKKAGADILGSPKEIYAKAEMIIKVKEPLPPEYPLIRKDQIIFTYFHFASSRELTDAMIKSRCIAIAYETVQKTDGSLPLLIPMSEVAGRMAPQEGAKYLEKTMGGRGVLLGGVPGTEPVDVVIIGGGVVGTNAAKIAAGLGAKVTILDSNLYRLRYLEDVMPKNVVTVMSHPYNILTAIRKADLLIGAVLIPGARAPHLVTRAMLKEMKPGSVIIDVSVDQGGCVETCKPTTHENPTYVIDGIVHYCVANMPGAVPFTSTLALTNATLPYATEIATKGFAKAVATNKEIRWGVNIVAGKITYKRVADAFGLPFEPLENFD